MIRINLLPIRAAQKKERLVSQLGVLAVVLLATFGVCVAFQFHISGLLSSEREKIDRAQEEINQLKKKIGEVNQIKNLQKELQGKLDILAELKAKKTGPVHLLDQLSSVVPDKLWIDSFKESGGVISITGNGFNEETIAGFLRDLDSSPYYKGVELQIIEQTGQDANKFMKFSLNCQMEVSPVLPAGAK